MRSRVIVTFWTAASVGAQAPKVIPEASACAQCRIVVRETIVLADEQDSSAHAPVTVREDARGRFWVFRQDEAVPSVYDRTGAFLRVLGRRGQGPAEFEAAYDMLSLPGDSVLVLDDRTRRGTVLDPSLRPTRTISVPLGLRGPVLLSWPRAVLGNGADPVASTGSLQVWDFRQSPARRARAFGPPAGDLVSEYGLLRQYLTRPREASIWVGGASAFRLYRWSVDGVLAERWHRAPPWLPEATAPRLGTPSRAPSASLVGITTDSAGRVWTVARLPGPEWKSGWPMLRPGTREVSTRDLVLDRLFVTLVEVFDPRLGRIVARQTWEGYAPNALPGAGLVLYATDAAGTRRTRILRLTLEGAA